MYRSAHYGFQLLTVRFATDKDWMNAIESMQSKLYKRFKKTYDIYHNKRLQDASLLPNQGAPVIRYNTTNRSGTKRTTHKHDKRDP